MAKLRAGKRQELPLETKDWSEDMLNELDCYITYIDNRTAPNPTPNIHPQLIDWLERVGYKFSEGSKSDTIDMLQRSLERGWDKKVLDKKCFPGEVQ